MQGFSWERLTYEFEHTNGWVTLTMALDETIYMTLRQRYKELFEKKERQEGEDDDVYQIESYITETGAGTIDADYINSRFIRYVKYLYTEGMDSENVKRTLQDLHHVFATLSQRDQRTALTIIHDIQNGDFRLSQNKNIQDYIKDYQKEEADRQVHTYCEITGMNADRMNEIVNSDVNGSNIDEHSRFTELMKTGNRALYKELLRRIFGEEFKKLFEVSKVQELTRRFILNPEDRAKILYAYFTEDATLDKNISDKTIAEDEDRKAEEKAKAIQAEATSEANTLSDSEMQEKISRTVMSNLRGFCPTPTAKSVDRFFNIVKTKTVDSLDGLEHDLLKVCEEVYGRRKVNCRDKHVGLRTLLVTFESYLRKVYYMRHGHDVPEETANRKTTLADILQHIPELWSLKTDGHRQARKLSEFLDVLRESRNSRNGTGAHGAAMLPEGELDKQLEQVMSLYIYVAGTTPL